MVMEGCDTGVCKVDTDNLLAKSDHDMHCSLHLVTKQMTVLITLYQVAPATDCITVHSFDRTKHHLSSYMVP